MQRSADYEASRPFIRIGQGDWAFQMYTPTRVCTWRVLGYFTKEPETIAWIADMPEGAVLYDVGANIGLYSVWAAVSRKIRVFAFEPEASNFSILNENLRANDLTETCLPFCVGVSDKVGLGAMQINAAHAGGSGHQVQVSSRYKVEVATPMARQGISTVTLDHLVYEQGLDCPTHLKIDVDGLEPAVVEGAGRLIRDPRLKSVMIELMVKEESHRAAMRMLVEAGLVKDDEMERAVENKTGGVAYTGNILFTRP